MQKNQCQSANPQEHELHSHVSLVLSLRVPTCSTNCNEHPTLVMSHSCVLKNHMFEVSNDLNRYNPYLTSHQSWSPLPSIPVQVGFLSPWIPWIPQNWMRKLALVPIFFRFCQWQIEICWLDSLFGIVWLCPCVLVGSELPSDLVEFSRYVSAYHGGSVDSVFFRPKGPGETWWDHSLS